jgi:DNA-binding CsgD family transcriptional regulator
VALDRDTVIAELYAAATGMKEWPTALDSLADLTGTRCITIDTYDLVTHVGTVLTSNIAPHPIVEDYNREFGRNNPLIEVSLLHLHSGAVFRASQLIDRRLIQDSDLFNLAYRPLGLKHVMSVFLDVTPFETTQYTVIKPDDAPDFSDHELSVFENLKPHLIQSWKSYTHLHATQMSLHTLTELWDCFKHAVFVLDGRRKVHFANRAAEDLLSNNIWACCKTGHIRLVNAQAHQALRQALVKLRNGRFQSISLPQADGLITLFRLEADRIVLLVTDSAQSRGWLQGLQIAYHLTRNEAELVAALVQGDNLRHYAEGHCIHYETARSHLKHAMQKNGWRRQSEMVTAILQRLLPTDLFDSSP